MILMVLERRRKPGKLGSARPQDRASKGAHDEKSRQRNGHGTRSQVRTFLKLSNVILEVRAITSRSLNRRPTPLSLISRKAQDDAPRCRSDKSTGQRHPGPQPALVRAQSCATAGKASRRTGRNSLASHLFEAPLVGEVQGNGNDSEPCRTDRLVCCNTSGPAPQPVNSARQLTVFFQRIANLDHGVFDRLGRYETAIARQVLRSLAAIPHHRCNRLQECSAGVSCCAARTP